MPDSIAAADFHICNLLNRFGARLSVERYFRFWSSVGDGIFWFILMLVVPLLYGFVGWLASLHLFPASLSIAGSRVVLGLHYPSDVLAGALVGALLGGGSLYLLV